MGRYNKVVSETKINTQRQSRTIAFNTKDWLCNELRAVCGVAQSLWEWVKMTRTWAYVKLGLLLTNIPSGYQSKIIKLNWACETFAVTVMWQVWLVMWQVTKVSGDQSIRWPWYQVILLYKLDCNYIQYKNCYGLCNLTWVRWLDDQVILRSGDYWLVIRAWRDCVTWQNVELEAWLGLSEMVVVEVQEGNLFITNKPWLIYYLGFVLICTYLHGYKRVWNK